LAQNRNQVELHSLDHLEDAIRDRDLRLLLLLFIGADFFFLIAQHLLDDRQRLHQDQKF